MTALATTASAAIDLRTIAPRDRHALIFGRFDAIKPIPVATDSCCSGGACCG